LAAPGTLRSLSSRTSNWLNLNTERLRLAHARGGSFRPGNEPDEL